uniref:Uncharacterized protein n=1 Tax=Arcella intermedia TaxID=1963864 RepID=A0A6B2LMU4_9EUKA
MHFCTYFGHQEAHIKFLISKGANPNIKNINGVYPIHYAAQFGYTESVRELLLGGSEVDVRTCANQDRLSPLHLATMYGHNDIVALLVEAQADVDLQCGAGYSAIDYAKKTNNQLILDILQKNKGELDLNEDPSDFFS